MNQAEIVKRWRKCKMPRLYWRSAHPSWRWDKGEIARTRDGASSTHYFTLAALLDELIEANCGEK